MDDAGDGAPRRGWLGAEIHHRHAAPAATGKEQRQNADRQDEAGQPSRAETARGDARDTHARQQCKGNAIFGRRSISENRRRIRRRWRVIEDHRAVIARRQEPSGRPRRTLSRQPPRAERRSHHACQYAKSSSAQMNLHYLSRATAMPRPFNASDRARRVRRHHQNCPAR